MNFNIVEVPSYFAKRDSGKSRLMKSPIEYAIKAWINLLRVYRDYEPLKFFGIIGAVFLGIGIIIGLFLFYNFLMTGVVGHVPLTLLSVLLMLLGIQIGLFGFLADMLKK
jgi:dolichol-phosphate mannosyltransferase